MLNPNHCCFAADKDLCSGKPADGMVALQNGTLAVFRGRPAPAPPLPPPPSPARPFLGPFSLPLWVRARPTASPPPHRSLLLAAERQEPADHQPPPDQRRLGHPIPHRLRLLQVQLRRQDLLHQGGGARPVGRVSLKKGTGFETQPFSVAYRRGALCCSGAALLIL